MANGNEESGATPQRVLELFKAGRSKADIARELGKDREWVKNALAKAIRGTAKKPAGAL